MITTPKLEITCTLFIPVLPEKGHYGIRPQLCPLTMRMLFGANNSPVSGL